MNCVTYSMQIFKVICIGGHAAPRNSYRRHPLVLRLVSPLMRAWLKLRSSLFWYARGCMVCSGDGEPSGRQARAHVYRSHFGSRYKLGRCGHAGLFAQRIDSTHAELDVHPQADVQNASILVLGLIWARVAGKSCVLFFCVWFLL